MFVPLWLFYPDANIPIVQLSLKTSLGPASHIRIGRALEPLCSEEVLILDSGMSYHNIDKLINQTDEISESDLFDAWLTESCAFPATERYEQLQQWFDAPAAGDDRGVRVFSDRVTGAMVSAFQFG